LTKNVGRTIDFIDRHVEQMKMDLSGLQDLARRSEFAYEEERLRKNCLTAQILSLQREKMVSRSSILQYHISS
jgi:hypothetical protein